MKNFTVSLLLICTTTLFAQKEVAARIGQLTGTRTAFTSVTPFTASTNNGAADALVRRATYARLDNRVTKSVFLDKPEYIELSLPYENTVITMLLYRVEIAPNDLLIQTDKQSDVPYHSGAYYRGTIKNTTNSLAAFSFFEREAYGIVSAPGIGNITVGRLDIPGNTNDYVIYADTDLITPYTFGCTTGQPPVSHQEPLPKNGQGVQSEHCVSLYFELRHNAYQANGNDLTQTINWFTALFNNVQTIFENDGITTAIKSLYVWESEDPYDMGTPSAYDLLDQFAEQTPVFDADAGQLINYGGGNGLAYEIGALCSNFNRSYAKVNPNYLPLPAYSQAVKIIAHELGHTLGSQHTHGCYWNGDNTAIDGCSAPEGDCPAGPIPADAVGGTIMSYCGNINFANGFGSQPTARILQHIAASQCLGTDCIDSCTNTISALDLIDTTPSTATLAWQDTEGALWEAGYASYGSEITNWQETSQNSLTIESLQSNTYYTFRVRNLCDTGTSPGSKVLSFCTGADWCDGALWTDTGGTDGNYMEQQHTVTIIKPGVSGQTVTVAFEEFWTQLQDVVYVYNGIGTSAPLIGSWTGYTPPSEPYVADNPSGALTFEFITDMGVHPSDGWVATVACSTMGITDAAFARLTYYPNPVQESLTVNLPTGLDTIALYTITGQLLVQKQADTLSYTLDMQPYASGLYLLKLSSGTAATHIKVIKQ